MIGFATKKNAIYFPYDKALPVLDSSIIKNVIDKIKNSKRPVLYAGNGIRISGGFKEFEELVNKLNIPVVTAGNPYNKDFLDFTALSEHPPGRFFLRFFHPSS